MGGLDQVVEQAPTNCSRACNTIAEFAHAQIEADPTNKDKAARYYNMAAE